MDLTKLSSIIPAEVLQHISDPVILGSYQINTRLRMSHFISQTMEESENYTRLSENLNYSAQGLLKTFPRYFHDVNTANQYAHQPEKIANYVYSGRMGNGSVESGDGWKYRGSGYLEITGRNNIKIESDKLGIDFIANPDLLRTPKYALLSAGYFWYANGLNKIADGGTSNEVITSVTKKINGGVNGLAQREANFQKVYPLIS